MKPLNCAGTSAEIGRQLKVNATERPTSSSSLDLCVKTLSPPWPRPNLRRRGLPFSGVECGLNDLSARSNVGGLQCEALSCLPVRPGVAETSRRTAAQPAAISRGRYRYSLVGCGQA